MIIFFYKFLFQNTGNMQKEPTHSSKLVFYRQHGKRRKIKMPAPKLIREA
jgi:hypothetical protein